MGDTSATTTTTDNPGEQGQGPADQTDAGQNTNGQGQQVTEPAGEVSVEQLTADRDKWKAMARKHEDRAKSNADAAQEWAKHQDSLKSNEQRDTEQRDTLSRERDTALAEAAVLRAAVKHNLTAEDLELLEGLSPDVVEDRAAKLAARVNRPARTTADPNTGRETPPAGGQTGDFLSNAFRSR